jgi:microcystin-dependent protein
MAHIADVVTATTIEVDWGNAVRDHTLPTGAIIFSAVASHSGFLLCQGQAVSRSTFAALFSAIGTTFGSGDGDTTFNVPNLSRRFPLGRASSGGQSTLGGTGGSLDHTHSGPSHSHSNPTSDSAGSHSHSNPTSGAVQFENAWSHDHTTNSGGTGSTGSAGSHSHSTSSEGAHNHSSSVPTFSAHSHSVGTASSHSHSGPSHTHTVSGVTTVVQAGASSNFGLYRATATSHSHSVGNTGSGGSHSHSVGSTGSAGTGSTGSENPPYLVLNAFIKT